jgi:hypothetical protein
MGRQSTLEKKAPVVRPGLRDDCLGGALNAPLGTKLGSGNADPPMRHKSSNASVSVTARRFESAGEAGRDLSSALMREDAARPVEAGDETKLDGVPPGHKDDRHRRGCGLGRERRRGIADDQGYLPAKKTRVKRVLDDYTLANDPDFQFGDVPVGLGKMLLSATHRFAGTPPGQLHL